MRWVDVFRSKDLEWTDDFEELTRGHGAFDDCGVYGWNDLEKVDGIECAELFADWSDAGLCLFAVRFEQKPLMIWGAGGKRDSESYRVILDHPGFLRACDAVRRATFLLEDATIPGKYHVVNPEEYINFDDQLCWTSVGEVLIERFWGKLR